MNLTGFICIQVCGELTVFWNCRSCLKLCCWALVLLDFNKLMLIFQSPTSSRWSKAIFHWKVFLAIKCLLPKKSKIELQQIHVILWLPNNLSSTRHSALRHVWICFNQQMQLETVYYRSDGSLVLNIQDLS